MPKPLAIDLYCGLGGWAEGFLSEGYRVIGFDIERHDYGTGGYPGKLILKDVLSLHGSRFVDASVIVASPPCQRYSYMAMPWRKAKALAAWYRESLERIAELNALFDACFRIQREACAAAGREIPLIVENVRGAQSWVGYAKWHFGSYFLWGDVPALMPIASAVKIGGSRGDDWLSHHNTKTFAARRAGVKIERRLNARDGHPHTPHLTAAREHLKVPGISWSGFGRPDYQPKGFNVTAAQRVREAIKGGGGSWFTPDEGSREKIGHWKKAGCVTRCFNSKSDSRRAASALIAKIPFPLAQHIARCFKPEASA